jgi:ABC-type multidrug transport system permease subunit
MFLRYSHVSLVKLILALATLAVVQRVGFSFICSFYPSFPPYVLTPEFMTVGYTLWLSFVESLPTGILVGAFIRNKHEFLGTIPAQANVQTSPKSEALSRLIFVGIILLSALALSRVAATFLVFMIYNAQYFSTDVLLLVNEVEKMYFNRFFLNIVSFVFFYIGYRVHSRIFVP